MMENRSYLNLIPTLGVACFFILIGACVREKGSGANHRRDMIASASQTRMLQLGEPETVTWSDLPADSLGTREQKRIRWDTIASRFFDFGEPMDFPRPSEEKPFDILGIPDTTFDLDALPSVEMKYKKIYLERPVKMKAEFAPNPVGSSRGVFEFKIPNDIMGRILCSMTDESGIMWFGTNNGLLRYDGINILAYKNGKGLSKFSISSLFLDRDKNIWIGTLSGDVYIFDRQTESVKHLARSFEDLKAGILHIYQDRDGLIWASSFEGFWLFDYGKNKVSKFGKKEGFKGVIALNMFEDQDGRIWIPAQGITIIDKRARTLKWLSSDHPVFGAGEKRFMPAGFFDRDSAQVYICSEQLYRFDLNRRTVKKIHLTNGLTDPVSIISILQEPNGTFWMGTEQGIVFKWNKSSDRFEKINLNSSGSNFPVFNLNLGKDGQIWLGGFGGTFIWSRKSGRPGNFSQQDGLASTDIGNITEDREGLIWLPSNSGLSCYDPKRSTLKHLGQQHGLPGRNVSQITLDQTGRIWMIFFPKGIAAFDGSNDLLITPGMHGTLQNNRFNALHMMKSGQIWLAAANGDILVYDPDRNTLRKFTDTLVMEQKYVSRIYEDSQGLIWIVSSDVGIRIMDPKNNTLLRLSQEQGLTSDKSITLAESGGEMWIGHAGDGIDIVNLRQGSVTSLNSATGLANDGVWNLTEWNGNMYAGTSLGLSVIRQAGRDSSGMRSWNIFTIGKDQGLNFLDFNNNTSLVSSRNQLWACVEGRVLTILDEPQFDTSALPVFITEINLFDEPIQMESEPDLDQLEGKGDTLWRSGVDTGIVDFSNLRKYDSDPGKEILYDSLEGKFSLPSNLRLRHDQNYVSFNYAVKQLSSMNDIVYRYHLKGLDDTWGPVTKATQTENYRDLHPGHYTFRVTCKGMSGQWSQPAEFSFTILPPWWRTWWAYGFYLLVFGVGLRGVHLFEKQRTIRKEREKIKDREIEHAREIEKAYHELAQSHENLKSTQNQLIHAEKMASLGELTAGIAHEIQNPLNFVTNFSEVSAELVDEMKEEITGGNTETALEIANDLKQNLEKIHFHGKRADGIVKGMLQHSRSGSGKKEPTHINSLADEYLRLAYHGLRAKDKSFNAAMKTDFDETIGNINIISQDIGRVILNLITNAFYAVNEKSKQNIPGYEPTVEVSTRKEGNRVLVRVKDNGNGIPQKILDKIFQPFFTTKPTGQGTGLGLSLSYDIVQAHGGEIRVETHENEGTEFIIQLPIS